MAPFPSAGTVWQCPPMRSLARLVVLPALLLLAACGDSGSSNGGGAADDPTVAGPYPVGVTRIELHDTARGRTLLTEVWYPADESARGLPAGSAASYLPPGLGFLADNATIPLVAVRDVPVSPDAPFPLVAFSHGSNGIRFQNSFQCEHLASHGYVVVAPDHQGNTFFDMSGNLAQLSVERPLDIIYVLDEFSRATDQPGHPFAGWVDTDLAFGVTGHSFGAFTSLAVASVDTRIAAALPMALGGPVSDDYTAATLLLLATQDKTIGLDGNQGVRDTFADLPGPRFIGEVVDAGHYSFSFACQTGLGIGDGDGCKTGTRLEDGSPVTFVSDLRVWDIVNGYSAALFGRYIKDIRAYDRVLRDNLDDEIMLYDAEPRGPRPAAFAAGVAR